MTNVISVTRNFGLYILSQRVSRCTKPKWRERSENEQADKYAAFSSVFRTYQHRLWPCQANNCCTRINIYIKIVKCRRIFRPSLDLNRTSDAKKNAKITFVYISKCSTSKSYNRIIVTTKCLNFCNCKTFAKVSFLFIFTDYGYLLN